MGKICPKFWAKPLPKNPKSPFTVDMRRSKALRFSPGSAWSLGVLSCPVGRAKFGKVSLADVTAHSRVQEWPSRERLGTRLPRDNKGSAVMSTIAKCRDVTYHPVSSLSSFSFSLSLSSSWSPSSSLDWKSFAWKSASSVRFYMKNQVATKVSSHAWVGGIWWSRWVSWHAGYQHTTINKL